ncbi:hypothetical protein C9374_000117 [Naegleria lovaniensis]|uniref:Uncharacterized protein n=1 Tax=Naegleria lovaniensis TaxID=51637 RepID=A0AA88GZV6_NAELO|nr:uncharacterized protein C9374_000117 [Naegleria lovaniensis]KAG2388678.1 hypothetical protein C9374_000117 [Naegleria lovaniensis]
MFVKKYSDCHILVDDPSSLTTDQLSKLQYYGFQLFTNTNILAAILSKDTSHLEITKTPSIPKQIQIKAEPEGLKRKEIPPPVVDEDATDDELAQPKTEPPTKKVKPTSEDTKKRKGIEIPLSLEALESESKPMVEEENQENSKKFSPKTQVKLEKKVPVKQERSHEEDDDAPKIVVEYINLIKVKDEKPASQNTYTGFNAKRFKKSRVKTSTSVISSSFSFAPPPQESMNFDEVTSPKQLAKEQDFITTTPKQQKEEKIMVTPPSSSKKETTSSVTNAIGIDEESDDSDDEAITLSKVSRKKR